MTCQIACGRSLEVKSPREPVTGRRRTVACPHPSFDTKSGQRDARGGGEKEKCKSYKRIKRHATQGDMIYQVNQGLPQEEDGNLNKWWNTYPGTRAITAEHRWMGGEKTEDSSVSHESKEGRYVQANGPGYTRACAATTGPMWNVSERPVSQVPQVMAREGGMLAPSTRLQHLGDSKVLLEKKRRGDTQGLPGSQGRAWKRPPRKLVHPRYRLPEPEGESVLGDLLLVTSCSDEQPLTSRAMPSNTVQVTPDCSHRT